MKRFLIIFFFGLLVCGGVQAVSLDGTTTPVYKTMHHVFHDRDTTQGFVDLCKGFTVVPVASGAQSTHGANLLMDTNVTVSGAIDLRGTNTLTLLRDLHLDEGVSFSDSGRIYSYGNVLVMNGDLTIPADKVLHCGGNLIIDGNGNTLRLGSSSQIFLDNSSTLTLRNMIIQTTHSYPGQPLLNVSSNLSKLALDNVVLSLGDDLHIPRGQLFFHNDVVVTGTSALVYRSIAPSYIAPHGTLMFDHGTTFSYAPATDNKDLIVLSDASSILAFDGSSLLATHTGLRLTKGRLYLDDKVALNSTEDNIINPTTSIGATVYSASTSSHPYSASWSPNGRYVAVVNYDSNTLKIFSFSAATPVQVGANVATGNNPYAVAWSPDGRYVAVVNDGSYTLQIFSFSGSTPVQVGGNAVTGNVPRSVSWSPDGRYLAVVNYSDNTLQIFSFTGTTPVQIGANVATGALPRAVAWSPDGKYVALVNDSAGSLQIFSFSGSTPVQVGSDSVTGNQPYSVSWSPDGNYLAVVTFSGKTLQIFSFAGSTPEQVGGDATTGDNPFQVAWSPDGRYVALVNFISYTLQIFSFSGGTPVQVGASASTGECPNSVSWSSDGRYIAVTNRNSDTLQIFTVNYQTDASTQSIDRSITFGNSALDSTHDLDVHVLSGARVEVTGNVYHDPA